MKIVMNKSYLVGLITGIGITTIIIFTGKTESKTESKTETIVSGNKEREEYKEYVDELVKRNEITYNSIIITRPGAYLTRDGVWVWIDREFRLYNKKLWAGYVVGHSDDIWYWESTGQLATSHGNPRDVVSGPYGELRDKSKP
jgi:hypothetical protein